MPTGASMNYVSGGDRPPPLTPVIYTGPTNRSLGHDWGHDKQKPAQQPRTPQYRPENTPGPKPHPEVAEMIRLYVDEQLTAPQVADAIGCAPKTVRTNLRRAGVQLRDDRTGQNLPRP